MLASRSRVSWPLWPGYVVRTSRARGSFSSKSRDVSPSESMVSAITVSGSPWGCPSVPTHVWDWGCAHQSLHLELRSCSEVLPKCSLALAGWVRVLGDVQRIPPSAPGKSVQPVSLLPPHPAPFRGLPPFPPHPDFHLTEQRRGRAPSLPDSSGCP